MAVEIYKSISGNLGLFPEEMKENFLLCYIELLLSMTMWMFLNQTYP